MSESLVQFLYLLLRDVVPAGQAERIVQDIEAMSEEPPVQLSYTNTDLESYARKLAGRLS